MMNYYGWGPTRGLFFGGSWFIGLLFWIAVGVLFILLIRALVYHNSGRWHEEDGEEQNKAGTRPDTALDTLKKRYAKGEINFKEFEKMKKDIQ